MYLNTYKQAACLNTLAGHIKNMFIGVTDGFRYKMHTVDKHFSIEMEIKGQTVLIKRFLGENDVKVVKLVEGVKASLVGKDQDEIWFEGIDVDSVSLNCGFLTRLARSSQR
jgi:large subunit ribosomal protein L6